MATKAQDAASKSFKAPSPSRAGIYIYRNSSFGRALKKTLKIDNTIIGESARYTFFHTEVQPGTHILSTESEFGDNTLTFNADADQNYYFRQYLKMGVFVAGSNLERVNEADGRKGVLECTEAQQTTTIANP